jgi:O-antigen/teichoic acid export membrane protein
MPPFAKLWSAQPQRLAAVLRPAQNASTVEGRAHERHRQIVLGAASSGLVRAVSVLTALVTVPLTLHYLGPERFGMWATLSSFNAFLSFTDFGIGNGVLTAVARHSGRDDEEGLRRYISTAYVALSGISLLMIALALISPLLFDWAGVFAVKSASARTEAVPAAVLFICLFSLGNPLAIIVRIQSGLQQQWRANLWLLAGSLASLAAVIAAIELEAGLVWLVLALTGTPLLLLLANSVIFLTRQRPGIAPRLSLFDRTAFRSLTGIGLLFMVLQLCAAVILQSNNLIIAQVLGASAVATFAVPDRMFAVVTLVMTFATNPLWAAYGEAAARGDVAWVRRTFLRSMVTVAVAASALSLALLLASPWLLRWWVGPEFSAPFGLLAGLALWRVIEALGSACAMLLNGVNQIRIQAVAGVLCAIATVLVRVVLVERIGVEGAVVGGIVAYLVICVPLLGVAVRGVFSSLARGEAEHHPRGSMTE